MKIINGKQQKGFAVMPLGLKREIARLGGKAIARKRGSKWMARIGRKGGKADTKKTQRIWSDAKKSEAKARLRAWASGYLV